MSAASSDPGTRLVANYAQYQICVSVKRVLRFPHANVKHALHFRRRRSDSGPAGVASPIRRQASRVADRDGKVLVRERVANREASEADLAISARETAPYRCRLNAVRPGVRS